MFKSLKELTLWYEIFMTENSDAVNGIMAKSGHTRFSGNRWLKQQKNKWNNTLNYKEQNKWNTEK